jgi:hypothetical protein
MKNFLTELTQLTKKYKITIGACGCCSSPWLFSEPELKDGKYTTAKFHHELTDELKWQEDPK